MEDSFSEIAALIGDKTRAKMLWSLLDGRAYTATELAIFADISINGSIFIDWKGDLILSQTYIKFIYQLISVSFFHYQPLTD